MCLNTIYPATWFFFCNDFYNIFIFFHKIIKSVKLLSSTYFVAHAFIFALKVHSMQLLSQLQNACYVASLINYGIIQWANIIEEMLTIHICYINLHIKKLQA